MGKALECLGFPLLVQSLHARSHCDKLGIKRGFHWNKIKLSGMHFFLEAQEENLLP